MVVAATSGTKAYKKYMKLLPPPLSVSLAHHSSLLMAQFCFPFFFISVVFLAFHSQQIYVHFRFCGISKLPRGDGYKDAILELEQENFLYANLILQLGNEIRVLQLLVRSSVEEYSLMQQR